jgi:glycosyltransferase involved in cell wall biosynthesis
MGVHNYFGKRAIELCDYITSVSQFEADSTIDILNVNPDKLKIIPNGVNVLDHLESQNIDLSTNIVVVDESKDINKRKKINLLYTGYLITRKGVDFLLESLNALIHDLKVKNVILTIVGEGPEKKNLLELSKELKLDKYIEWKPFLSRDKLLKKIKDSDIFLLLSRSEAYGITVAEALVLGTPCIITESAALKEFSNEPGCFIVDYPPKPHDVADKILDVYRQDVTIGPFTEKIQPWNKISKDYEELYEGLLSK